MAANSCLKKVSVSDRWIEFALIGFIGFMCIQYIIISGRRYFNFDEFQVLYAGAAQLRGKSLYADSIDGHFPFFNMVMSFLIALSGFKTTTLLVARYFILMVNGITLFCVYRITELLWDKRTGLLAVALSLSSFVFLNKGIEIRHDIFNTFFVVLGGYFALRHIRETRFSYLILSALSFGCAVASTQKATIWVTGMIFGMILYFFRMRLYKDLARNVLVYLVLLGIPLSISIFSLMLVSHESLHDFLKWAIYDVGNFWAQRREGLFPFPYNRFAQAGRLIYQNGLFYALACGGILAGLISWLRHKSEEIVVAAGALFGTLFYLFTHRPFYQTFLPNVPLLAVLASGMAVGLWHGLRSQDLQKRAGFGLVFLFLLFIWPTLLIIDQKSKDQPMISQLDNVSFCLASLKEDEKVLSYTQNQIFFDPVLRTSQEECGLRFHDYDADCFEKKMIDEQCKVIINDYRTKLMNQEIQKKIAANYVPTKFGDILIPGFRLPAGAVVNKKVWIKGDYYSPARSVEVEGRKMDGDLIHLDQKEYRLKNTSNSVAYLIYVFDKSGFLDEKNK